MHTITLFYPDGKIKTYYADGWQRKEGELTFTGKINRNDPNTEIKTTLPYLIEVKS